VSKRKLDLADIESTIARLGREILPPAAAQWKRGIPPTSMWLAVDDVIRELCGNGCILRLDKLSGVQSGQMYSPYIRVRRAFWQYAVWESTTEDREAESYREYSSATKNDLADLKEAIKRYVAARHVNYPDELLDSLKAISGTIDTRLKAIEKNRIYYSATPGRPRQLWKKTFVDRMCCAWCELTGEPAPRDAHGLFASFVDMAWASIYKGQGLLGFPHQPPSMWNRTHALDLPLLLAT
jgi:hypothetical protein